VISLTHVENYPKNVLIRVLKFSWCSEDSILLGYDATSLVNQLPLFRGHHVAPKHQDPNPVTQHNPEFWNSLHDDYDNGQYIIARLYDYFQHFLCMYLSLVGSYDEYLWC
jgi:hypothetical protein